MAFPKRVDRNQPEIVSKLRKLGMSVLILSSVGKGCPDLCVGYQGKTYLIEIKNGDLPPSKQKLTEDEQAFFDTWLGHACIINSVDDAIAFFNDIHVD